MPLKIAKRLFIFLFILVPISIADAAGPSQIIDEQHKTLASDKFKDRAAHYPALVVGDIESLIPLSYTKYLDGRPVLFFSKSYQTKEPLELLKKANTVIFQEGGMMELSLDLLPWKIKDSRGKEVIRRFFYQKDGMTFLPPSQGYYEIFVKIGKEEKEKPYITIDKRALYPTHFSLEEGEDQRDVSLKGDKGKGLWRYIGVFFFAKKEHILKAQEGVTEIVIIPQRDFQRHYHEVTRLLSEKATIAHLFSNDKEKGRIFDADYSILRSGEYRLSAYVKPATERIVYRDIVNRLKGEGERSKEYNVNIDLSEYPNVDVAYIKDRAGIDHFFLLFGIDVNGDNLTDVVGYAGDYRTRIREKFLSIPMAKIEIEKMGYGTTIRRFIPGRGDKKWYYNAFGSGLTVNHEGDVLVLSSDMKKERQFILVREFPSIDLTEYPYIGLDYRIDNPGQKLKMRFKVDTNGDRRPDREFETDFDTGERPPLSDGFIHLSINTVKIAGVCPVSGGKDEGFDLVEVTIFFQGGGNFYLRDFNIYNKTVDIPFHVRSRLIPGEDSDVPIFLPLETEEREIRGMDIMKVSIYDQFKEVFERLRKQLKDKKGEGLYKDRLVKVVAMLGRDEGIKLPFEGTLKNIVKEIAFYRDEDIKIPGFIAESMHKEEWRDKLESEGGWRGYNSKSYFLVKDYAVNERFLWKEVKYNQLDLLTWEVKGEDAFFTWAVENNFLKISTFFSNETRKRGRIILSNSLYKKGIFNKSISPIDLKRFSTFDISCQGYNPLIQRMSIILGLDFNGDGKEDTSVHFPIYDNEISGSIGKDVRIGREALKKVEELYPLRKFYYISDIRVSLENRETGGEKVFYLKGIRFYSDENRGLLAQVDERGYVNKSVSLEPIEMAFADIYEPIDTLNKVTWWKVVGEKVFYSLENVHGNLKLVFGTKYMKKGSYIALSKRFSDIDLEKYPFIRFDYIISKDVDVQDPFINVILDIKGERHAFRYAIQEDRFRNYPGGHNLYKELKKKFPQQKKFLLNGVTIELGKNFSYKGSEKIGLILKGFKVFSKRRGDMAEYLNSTGFRYQDTGWKGDGKWRVAGNSLYEYKEDDRGKWVRVEFKEDMFTEEGVFLKIKPVKTIDIERFPLLLLDYNLDNPSIQKVEIALELDTNGDVIGDTEIKPQTISGNVMDIGKLAKYFYPGRRYNRLTAIELYLKKGERIDCKENNLTGYYNFLIRDIELLGETIGTFHNKILSGLEVKAGGKRYFIKDFEKEEVEGIFNSYGMLLDFGRLNLKPGKHKLRFKGNEYFNMNMVVLESADNPVPVISREEAVIQFEKINPTRYLVDVKTRDSFWLVFSESFHEGWRAYIREKSEVRSQKKSENRDQKPEEPWSALLSAWRDRGNRVEINDHFMVNGYANGWMVPIPPYPPFNKGGKGGFSDEKAERGFQIVLEYKPQRLFEIGVIISLITLVGCIVYLGYDWGRRRGKRCKSSPINN